MPMNLGFGFGHLSPGGLFSLCSDTYGRDTQSNEGECDTSKGERGTHSDLTCEIVLLLFTVAVTGGMPG